MGATGPTRFCPTCYARNPFAASRCTACRSPLQSSGDFVDALIWALGHPDTETAMRAAAILGARHEARALAALAARVGDPHDPYRAAACAAALVALAGEPGAEAAIRVARQHPSAIVRRAAGADLDAPVPIERSR